MPAKPYLVTRPLVANNRPGQEGERKFCVAGLILVFAGARRASENRTLLLADAAEERWEGQVILLAGSLSSGVQNRLTLRRSLSNI